MIISRFFFTITKNTLLNIKCTKSNYVQFLVLQSERVEKALSRMIGKAFFVTLPKERREGEGDFLATFIQNILLLHFHIYVK